VSGTVRKVSCQEVSASSGEWLQEGTPTLVIR
jgi:hypothetical protein